MQDSTTRVESANHDVFEPNQGVFEPPPPPFLNYDTAPADMQATNHLESMYVDSLGKERMEAFEPSNIPLSATQSHSQYDASSPDGCRTAGSANQDPPGIFPGTAWIPDSTREMYANFMNPTFRFPDMWDDSREYDYDPAQIPLVDSHPSHWFMVSFHFQIVD